MESQLEDPKPDMLVFVTDISCALPHNIAAADLDLNTPDYM